MRSAHVAVLLLAVRGRPASALDLNDGLHGAVANAGDVNLDGVPDMMVASRYGDGIVWILSGKDGSLLRTLEVQRRDPFAARSLANAGDVNGDGIDDQIVGASEAAFVFCGSDGSIVHRLVPPEPAPGFGFFVAGNGDVDGDEAPDLIVTSDGEGSALTPRVDRPGRVFLFSGRSGAPLSMSFPRPAEPPFEATGIVTEPPNARLEHDRPIEMNAAVNLVYGRSAAFCPDVDGDGIVDLLLLAHEPAAKRVYLEVRSGSTGARLRANGLPYTQWNFEGWRVGLAGDADADGVQDHYLSVINGRLLVYSGKDGCTLLSLSMRRGYLQSAGATVDRAGDVDGDGHDDLVVGANEIGWWDDPGFANVYSGRTGEVIRSRESDTERGMDVCGAGDLNGDQVPDAFLEHRKADVVQALSGKDFSVIFEVKLSDLARESKRRAESSKTRGGSQAGRGAASSSAPR